VEQVLSDPAAVLGVDLLVLEPVVPRGALEPQGPTQLGHVLQLEQVPEAVAVCLDPQALLDDVHGLLIEGRGDQRSKGTQALKDVGLGVDRSFPFGGGGNNLELL